MKKLIYGDIATPVTLVKPQVASAGDVTGEIVDRIGYYDGIAFLQVGAATGAPTTQSATLTIYSGEADDGSDMTVYKKVDGLGGGNYATTALTTDNEAQAIDIDLAGAGRYVRATVAVAFTGGTAPKQQIAATLVLGQNTAPIIQNN